MMAPQQPSFGNMMQSQQSNGLVGIPQLNIQTGGEKTKKYVFYNNETNEKVKKNNFFFYPAEILSHE